MQPSEFYQVEKFAKGFKGCLESRLNNLDGDATIVREVLETVIGILDLHLKIAELETEQEIKKMADTLEGRLRREHSDK